MFLFVSIYWVYSFYLKDIWLVSFLNERQTKKRSTVTFCDSASFFPEALSRIVMSLPICFIYRDILG